MQAQRKGLKTAAYRVSLARLKRGGNGPGRMERRIRKPPR